MPWSHLLTGYAPGIGTMRGAISIRSRQVGTLTNDSLRLANLVNLPLSRQGIGVPTDVNKIGTPISRDDRGLFLDVPNVIVRFGPITGATISGTNVTVTIATGHNLQTGEDVIIRQVVGSVELNNFFDGSRITRLTDTTFRISGVASITAFSASANSIVEVSRPFASINISSFVNATGVFTTAAAHSLAPGDKIFISQVTGLTFTGPTWLNTPVTVRSTPTATTFTIFENAALTGAASGGNITAIRTINNFGQLSVRSPRTIALASISNANPAVFTSSVNHGLQIGDRVFVSGVQGTAVTALNASTAIVRTVPAANAFILEDAAGAPISGAGSTATANTGIVYAPNSPTVLTSFEGTFNFEIPVFSAPNQAAGRRGPFNA